MITYTDIYETARKERYTEQLQKISKNFLVDLAVYLKEKKEIALKENDVFSDVIIKTKKQFENSITLFKELIVRRRKKILKLVLIATETGISKQDFDNMFNFEKTLFEDLMKCVDDADKKINEILGGKEISKKNELILFLEDMGEFVGLEGEKMGPYQKGEIVNLSKEIAKILIEDKKAEVVLES